jgi:hypothetical protein
VNTFKFADFCWVRRLGVNFITIKNNIRQITIKYSMDPRDTILLAHITLHIIQQP